MSDLAPGGAAGAAEPPGDEADRARPKKAPNAFRTISEVADDLHIPQHVLRFWETKFPQVKPLKRGGGRRYYRPDDIALLRRISDLLYTQGYTIKGVQRLLREGGGRLSDNIPPPAPEERELTVMTGEGEAADLPPAGVAPARRAEGRDNPAALPPAPARADARVQSLRAVLQSTLTELEALRALLD